MISSRLLCCLTALLILPSSSNAADPDPLQDICIADLDAKISVNGFPCKSETEVTSDDFFFDLSEEGNLSNAFGRAVTEGNVHEFPGVNTQGISTNRVDLAVGGINPPHLHPRSSESSIVIRGTVLVGIITTDNVFYSKVVTAGMLFLIPRGLVHFQLNVGKENVLFFPSFNSQLPGTQFVHSSLFNTTPPIPNEVLTKTFLVGDEVINAIKAAITSAQLGHRPK
ncbi:Germin-like protein subfamily T member 2 [Citrus sinensis]|uniref:Germin-like protein n=1 Tax=Citrus clementina TaxID=85681 RepID=V4SKM8_CITCL|nr:germin-like protein subfamily T member 2 [Citrus sinensis]ESR41182.1 hypothetical protein CICLE_v10027146mg [Citrus x clementina]KAH9669468.1 Germin-like protein subfamily T member 2 [Citrus sinensis]